jgi:hypothetical protein
MKNKGGRPRFLITPQILEKAESLAARGLNFKQIANCLDIAYETLNAKRKEYLQFSQAIARGQDKGISIIANALFEGAKKGNTTTQIFYMKSRAGWKDNSDNESTKEESKRKVRNAEKQYK